MITEITGNTNHTALAGWLCYDGSCAMCTRGAMRWKHVLARRGIDIVPLQTRWVGRRFGLAPDSAGDEIKLLLADGRVFGGADALIEIARRIWWAAPLAWLAALPGVRGLLVKLYRYVAARRTCADGVCAVHSRTATPTTPATPRTTWLDWLPLFAMTAAAAVLARGFAAWIYMWLIAVAVFAGFKWLTWRDAVRRLPRVTMGRSLAYLLAWPGMDAAAFLDARLRPHDPPSERFIALTIATINILLGGVLLVAVTPMLAPASALAAGWAVMIGLALMLHFGLFAWLAQLWRGAGVDATPLMAAPPAATSLADFWGRRWNRAFRVLAFDYVFAPLRRRLGPRAALIVAFLFSGLLHDLVISVPARGGYGLATLYFLAQGGGMLFERSRLGRAIGLGRGLPGRLFAIVMVTAPMFGLFHPWFVGRVIMPMAQAFGAM